MLADHEDRIADHDGQIDALNERVGDNGRMVVPDCADSIGGRFESLDAALRDYWSDLGPDAPVSCLDLEVGSTERSACSSYAIWYEYAATCRSDRARAYAARIVEREGLN